MCTPSGKFFFFLYFLTTPFLGFSQSFRATGTDNSNDRPAQWGVPVRVQFDQLPTSLEFHMPSFPSLNSENNIRFTTGYAETYDPDRWPQNGWESWELQMDHNNRYVRMWWESQNEARIVVRVRGALVSPGAQMIAHEPECGRVAPAGSDYGPGDWVDEWYYIYPDGSHIRKSKVYTCHAITDPPGKTYVFGDNRFPPNYTFEFFEATVFLRSAGQTNDINNQALTLINMDGQSSNISYTNPYPQNFGSFNNANIMVVNLNSEYRPFVIGKPDSIDLRPYEGDPNRNDFVCWSGDVCALAHMINPQFFEQTDTSLMQIYLQGWTNEQNPSGSLAPLAKSWWNPAMVNLLSDGYEYDKFDKTEKAFKFKQVNSSNPNLSFLLQGTQTNPIVNPVLIIDNWQQSTVNRINLNNQPLSGFKTGMENGKLIVWLPIRSQESSCIDIITDNSNLSSCQNSIEKIDKKIFIERITGSLNVSVTNDFVNSTLSIMDIRGKIILENKIIRKSLSINTKPFGTGIYLFKLSNRLKEMNQVIFIP